MIIRNVTEQLSDNSKEPPFCTIHNFKSYDSSVIQNHNRFPVFQISHSDSPFLSFNFSNLSLFKFLNCLIQFLSSLIYTYFPGSFIQFLNSHSVLQLQYLTQFFTTLKSVTLYKCTWVPTLPSLCDLAHVGVLCTFSNTSAAAAAGFARSSQLSSS